MPSKKVNFKINLDSPCAIFFVLLCFVFFFLKKYTGTLLFSPTMQTGENPFNISSFSSYLSLFLYVFGNISLEKLIFNSIVILLLCPALEERYGSLIVAIMMLFSELFTGVLASCFCKNSIQGSDSIVIMMLFLNVIACISKKKIPLTVIFVFALFIKSNLTKLDADSVLVILMNLAGGLCGSLFAFLSSKSSNKRVRKNASSKVYDDSEETIIGRLEI